jgi:hypothetical protein
LHHIDAVHAESPGLPPAESANPRQATRSQQDIGFSERGMPRHVWAGIVTLTVIEPNDTGTEVVSQLSCNSLGVRVLQREVDAGVVGNDRR